MSITFPQVFTRPFLLIQNAALLPIATDQNGDGVPTTRMGPFGILTTYVLLDSLLEQYQKGRSYGDDQLSVYRTIEDRISLNYGLDGRSCVLRFICELQHYPIKDWTIFGELLTAVFTPRWHDGDHHDLDVYLKALWEGQTGDPESCKAWYGYSCPFSVFNYFNSEEEQMAYDAFAEGQNFL